MIKNTVYIPYLEKSVTVTANDVDHLMVQIKEVKAQLRSLPEHYGWHHVAEGLLQAYNETLDTLREGDSA